MKHTGAKLFSYAVSFSAMTLIALTCSGELNAAAKEPPQKKFVAPLKPGAARSYKIGFVPVPKESSRGKSSVADWLETFSVIQKNAEVAVHHTHLSRKDWEIFSNSPDAPHYEAYAGIEFIVLMAKERNLDVLMVVDYLTTNRENISDNPFGNSFDDPRIRSAIQNFSIRVARDFRRLTGRDLTYLAVGSEVNTYIAFHPLDAANFVSLFKQTRDLIKSEFKNTRVTCTFQYELMSGRFNGKSDWTLIPQLGSALDIVAITTYPAAFFKQPDDLPSNYYRKIYQFTDKPMIIAESGWPSGGDPNWHGSPQNQGRFLNKIVELTSGLNLELWIWWFLHDSSNEGYPAYFRTMGLRTSNGQTKPAWNEWQRIAKLNQRKTSSA